MPCLNHPGVPDVHDGLCQPCLNTRRAAARRAGAAAPVAPPPTPEAILARHGNPARYKDGKGEYLVNGAKGMHVHVYGSDYGVHVKVGNDKHLFISVKNEFLRDGWNAGVAAVHARATEDLHDRLLAAMGKVLMGRNIVDRAQLQILIGALPFRA